MRRRHLLSLLILFSLGITPSGHATAADPVESGLPTVDTADEAILPFDDATTVGTLPNGLRYYIRENRQPEDRAELRLVLNAGSILENDDQLGLAHFVEHMAFNGSEHFAHNRLIETMENMGMEFGPDVNAHTTFDETVFMLTVPTDRDSILQTGLEILRDWAGSLNFTPEEIDKERGVVIEEWRRGLGASQRVRDQILPVLYQGSLYAKRLPIGKKKILENFPHSALIRFYHDWYRPDLMAVVAVGDFDPKKIEAGIRGLFSDLSNPEPERARISPSVPSHEATRFSLVKDKELTVSRVQVLVQTEPSKIKTVKDYRRSVIEGLWFHMLNARLSELVQKPNPPFISAYAGRGGSIRAVDEYNLSTVVGDGGVDAGLKAVLQETARAARHGFLASELEREKKNRLRGLERQYRERLSTESAVYAASRSANFLDDSPVPGIEYLYALNQALLPDITLEEVNAVAPDFFQEENRVIVVAQPDNEETKQPTPDELRDVFQTVSKETLDPYREQISDKALVQNPPQAGTIVKRSHDPDLDLYTWTLSNGARVFLKPTDFKDDEVLMGAYRFGGSSTCEGEEHWSCDLAGHFIPALGVGDFTPPQFAKKLAGKQLSVRPYISQLEEGVNAACSPSDFDAMLQTVYLYFTDPRDDQETFDALRQRWSAVLANRAANPEQAFSDTLSLILAQHHPRARPLTSQALEEVRLQPAYEFFRRCFSDANGFTFVFVGNLDPEKVEGSIEEWIGGLPELPEHQGWRDLGIRPPDEVVTRKVHRGEEPKSRTAIVFSGDFQWNRANRHAISSLAQLLEIRLRDLIREELSGTYAVRVAAYPSLYPVPSYSLNIMFGCDPARLDELSNEVFAALAKLKTVAPSEDEVAKLKEQQSRQLEVDLRINRKWLNWIEFRDRYGIDQREQLDSEDLIDSLNAETLQSAARRYLDLKRYVQVSLVPEG